MEKFIITTGRTIDAAVSAALAELNMDRTSVSVEVLENHKSGFFGIGACPAKIKVTYQDETEVVVPKGALSGASRRKPEHAYVEATPETPAKPQSAKPQTAPRPQGTNSATAVEDKRPAHLPTPAPRPSAEPKVYPVAEAGSIEARIEGFIKGLLEHMNSDAVPHAVQTGETAYLVDLVGENLGVLIGHRGDTLDSIQH